MERTKEHLKKFVETNAASPLVTMRTQLETYNKTINDHKAKMVPGVAESYYYILSRPARDELTDLLEAEKKKLDAFVTHFKKVDLKFKCRLKKMCYIEDIKEAQIEFSNLWSAVENLKANCKGKKEFPIQIKQLAYCVLWRIRLDNYLACKTFRVQTQANPSIIARVDQICKISLIIINCQ